MNRLANESSPYLLQHRNNPVDWYPWGDEAFERARSEDLPIFLSIGYATCHWCHVMERESFEDDAVAALLNDGFVSIKVDREERPDIDQVYMTVCQLMGGSCGWPLTVMMTPSMKPFFVATYIPRESRFGRVGMLDLLPRVQELWSQDRGKVDASAGRLVEAVRNVDRPVEGSRTVDALWLNQAFEQLASRYDETNGGFGGAPKFPAPHNLLFLLRYAYRTVESQAIQIVRHTLDAMRRGGVFDQVGFGFHRYSTDAEWKLPHFEKMLYDQALHIMAYTEAYQATGDDSLATVAREVADYVLRDLTSDDGGFYSAEDADSEGVEGKFYVWSMDELRETLPADLADLVVRTYGIRPEGNFLEEATRELTGDNVLHRERSVSLESPDRGPLEEARQVLFQRRAERPRPLLDDKILTDWNGLMVAALSKLGAATREPTYVDAAERATVFLLERLREEEGGLLHRYRAGESGIVGHLQDYAFLTWGLIELYHATYRSRHLAVARDLCDRMIELFWDGEDGGFFMTAADGEPLIARLKDFDDGAIPSGNAAALLCLLRLGRLTGETGYDEKAAALLASAAPRISRYPSAYTGLLLGLEFIESGPTEVVITGKTDAAARFAEALRARFLPSTVSLRVEPGDDILARVASFTNLFSTSTESALAFVCRNHVCAAPTDTVEGMLANLGAIDEDFAE